MTTLATALGIAWPGERMLLEADSSGGDLAFRAKQPSTGQLLAADPGLLTLAADARTGLPAADLARYCQATAWGLPVVPGPAGAQAYQPMRALWPAVAGVAAAWPGTVIADLGRFQPGNPAAALARAATAVLVVTRVSVEDLYHLRERVNELAHTLGDPRLQRHPVAVVVSAPRKEAAAAVRQVAHMLQAGGSPIPVAGYVATDPVSAASLRAGELPKRGARSDLLASAGELAATLGSWWPELIALSASPAAAIAAPVLTRSAAATPTDAGTVPGAWPPPSGVPVPVPHAAAPHSSAPHSSAPRSSAPPAAAVGVADHPRASAAGRHEAAR
ncbi:hypothetical protein [Kineosporia sp. A_224]|uniref:hypothetical protein n=1 Tax=Kineosporia sp. A_224 TaxID=1962180 RepID=UPI00117BC668|nr:hypothetical protein [Kineosporia sp. A_224]